MREYGKLWEKTLSSLHRFIVLASPVTLDVQPHSHSPGDWVYGQTWSEEPLKQKWKGPLQVLLTIHTAVKITGGDSWIHYTRPKPAPNLEMPLQIRLKQNVP